MDKKFHRLDVTKMQTTMVMSYKHTRLNVGIYLKKKKLDRTTSSTGLAIYNHITHTCKQAGFYFSVHIIMHLHNMYNLAN